MRAAVRRRYGPPEAVRIEEVPKPAPSDGEVLVKVHVTTVNRTDCGFRSGKPFLVRFFSGLTKPKVVVLGSEFAGVVEAVGKNVTSFAPGERVFGFSNETVFGAHAEYLVIPEDGQLARMPANMTFEQVAAGTEASHYAMSFIRRAKMKSGHDVMVYGATGAIGSAAVQLLKRLGANVTAVCATPHVELVRSLGPDKVVDYIAQDFTKDEQKYDFVMDAVGKSSFARCKPLLKPHGIYLSSDFGPLAQNPFLALVTPLLGRKKVMFPLPLERDRASAEYLEEMIESGSFKPVIDRRYTLDQIADAYAYVEAGQKIGNVLVVVDPAP